MINKSNYAKTPSIAIHTRVEKHLTYSQGPRKIATLVLQNAVVLECDNFRVTTAVRLLQQTYVLLT